MHVHWPMRFTKIEVKVGCRNLLFRPSSNHRLETTAYIPSENDSRQENLVIGSETPNIVEALSENSARDPGALSGQSLFAMIWESAKNPPTPATGRGLNKDMCLLNSVRNSRRSFW